MKKFVITIFTILITYNCISQNKSYKNIRLNDNIINISFLCSFPSNKSYDEFLQERGYSFKASQRSQDKNKYLSILKYKNKIKDDIYQLDLYKEKILYAVYISNNENEYKSMLNFLKKTNFKYTSTDTSIPNEISTVYSNRDVTLIFTKRGITNDFKYSIQASNNARIYEYNHSQ